MTAVATTADFAPATRECPACGAECKRHSIYTRRIRDISLDGPVSLQVRVGNYRCPVCRKFHKPELPFAGKGKRYTTRAVRKATVSVQEDKTTYCALPNRSSRDFNIKPSKATGWAWFQQFAAGIDPEDYLRWACSRFSGQLSVDSIQEKSGSHFWFATDPLNKDTILGYAKCKSPDAESLTAFLTTLRDRYGIVPQLFIGDDASVFDSVPQQVWPDAPVQLCIFHVLKNLSYNYLRHSLRARLLACKPVKPDFRRIRNREQRRDARRAYKAALETWTETHRKRRLFLKSERNLLRPESVERGEAAFVASACERYPAVGTFRRFMVDFHSLINATDAAWADLFRQTFLAAWRGEAATDQYIGHVVGKVGDDRWFVKLFRFTAFENADRTTNSTERANRWFRKRQKGHYRLRKEETVVGMLHADLIHRRQRTPDGDPPNRLQEKPAALQQSA